MRRGVPAAPETRTVDGFRGRLVRLSDRPVLRERAQLSNKQNVRLVRKPRGSVVGARGGSCLCVQSTRSDPLTDFSRPSIYELELNRRVI